MYPMFERYIFVTFRGYPGFAGSLCGGIGWIPQRLTVQHEQHSLETTAFEYNKSDFRGLDQGHYLSGVTTANWQTIYRLYDTLSK